MTDSERTLFDFSISLLKLVEDLGIDAGSLFAACNCNSSTTLERINTHISTSPSGVTHMEKTTNFVRWIDANIPLCVTR